ncbi:hypothetical protein M2480_002404 [Parabacteroides sp. PFB2-12]|uniref:Ig-like domain-containing protein n=1 Tax=unclassified Parabacteroides TaxID=2649774 RepID=UPI0024743B8D|nr:MULTISPECIES: Ig-like domain-containing protein [unclassified Parabacteroides]MDH6343610.1 hypothetical protein [Parabacteroides sp. PM6-13]MDH6391409.1 hypothetical protein [Parabacteroides sp. PFB2-12]
MASNSVIRKGTCMNIGNCPNANEKKIIEVGIGEDFVCPNPECGGALKEIKEKGSPAKGLLFGLLALLVLAGGGAAVYFLLGKEVEPAPVLIESIQLNATELQVEENKTAQLTYTFAPLTALADSLVWHTTDAQVAEVENGLVSGYQSGKTTISVIDLRTQVQASCEVEVIYIPEEDPSSGIAVEGGQYLGETLDGLPHGLGTIRYTERTLISKRDMKKRQAEPGQYITGEFYKGELVQGRLFNRQNEVIEVISVGRPG